MFNPSRLAAVVPRSISVEPTVTESFTSIAFVTPAALIFKVSVVISIEESSTFTAKTPLVTPIPSPATSAPRSAGQSSNR